MALIVALGGLSPMCRICLGDFDNLENIFERNPSQGKVTANLITEYASVHITRKDGLPSWICEQCLYELDIVCGFIKLCHRSDAKLKGYLGKLKNIDFIDETDGKSESTDMDFDYQSDLEQDMVEEVNEKIEIPESKATINTPTLSKPPLLKVIEPPLKKQPEEMLIAHETEKIPLISPIKLTSQQNPNEVEQNPNEIEQKPSEIKQKLSEIEQTPNEIEQKPNVSTETSPQKIQFEQKFFKVNETETRELFLPEIEQDPLINDKNDAFDEFGTTGIKCEYCNRTFTQRKRLTVHTRIHTGETPYQCDVCDKRFMYCSSWVRHKVVHSNLKPFSCTKCSKSFKLFEKLKAHQLCHSDKKPYKCELCSKCFKTQSDKKVHLRVHSNERPYSCDICGKTYKTNSDIIIHKRSHTGTRPYKCDVCPKDFKSSNVLKTHKRTHTKERPYKCEECSKTFINSSSLTSHKRIHSGEKPYECDTCHKKFRQSSNLKNHVLNSHSSDRTYKCDECFKNFKCLSNLIGHKRVHLKKVMPAIVTRNSEKSLLLEKNNDNIKREIDTKNN